MKISYTINKGESEKLSNDRKRIKKERLQKLYLCKYYANEKTLYIEKECKGLIISVGTAGFEPATLCL